jgi:glycosyltransferase involved in cell wall biosynthesis
MTGADRIDLSLVIPAYNEEESIEDCVREADGVLSSLGKRYEIVVVDDGSTDGTFERLRSLKKTVPALRAARFKEHRGQTTAMAAGFERARGAVIATMDADMQNDPADIPRLLERLSEWDIVCGVREKRRDTFVKRASSLIANAVRNRFTHENIRDVGCTLRVYRREYLDRVKLFEGMHRFLPTLLKLEGARVVEIPVNHRPRMRGANKYGIGNRLFKGLRDLSAVRWMQSRHIQYDLKEEIK